MKMKNFDEAVEYGVEMLQRLMIENKIKMKKTYLNGEGDCRCLCKISMGLTFAEHAEGINVKAELSFVESRVKVSISKIVSPQAKLPLEEFGGEGEGE